MHHLENTNILIMKKIILTLLTLVIANIVFSQTLEEYVNLGLENNLALQQKQVDYKIATKSLKEAKGLFFPNVSFNARYTVAAGGRVIEFPIGDLLNPVYKSLNELMQLPPENQFPTLENQEYPFLRPQEQETKVSLVQPIFNAKLNANYKLKKEQLEISSSQLKQYQNELSYEIKKAYFDYLKTVEVVKLLNETSKLVAENLRVNQKLVNNAMATKDVILKAQTEVSKLEMQCNEAEKNQHMAQYYFNFLLNQPLDGEIKIDSSLHLNILPPEEILLNIAWRNREELKQMNLGSNVYEQLAKVNSAENIPSVFLAADYGIQGEQYSFTSEDDYAMVTLGLKWTIFNGNTNKSKRDQALLQKEQIQLKKLEVEQLIQLELRNAILDFNQKKQNLNVATKQVTEANESYRMIDKKYKNGTASQLELVDAQNTKTQAEMNEILMHYDQLNSLANLEKVVGSSLQ